MYALIAEAHDDLKFKATTDHPRPELRDHDLMVEVKAVSVNPVDTKVRDGRQGRVLGWDASGVVIEVGPKAEGFAVGDAVYYAGDITRDGTNAQYHAVDARLVAHKPRALSHPEAAALPLTALTAWEGLYEQLQIEAGQPVLIIAGAGGVGSLAIQLAKLAGARVITTASRPETRAWVEELGADDVINHREDMPAQLQALGLANVPAIFCAYGTAMHFEAMAEMIAPGGRIVSIVETSEPLPLMKLFSKRASFGWEFMFARAMHQTPDMHVQGEILAAVAESVDAGKLRSTLQEVVGPLNAENLTRAHAQLASGSMIGKLALTVEVEAS